MKNCTLLILSLALCLSGCENKNPEKHRYSLKAGQDTSNIKVEAVGLSKGEDNIIFYKSKSDTAYLSYYQIDKEIEFKIESDIDSLKIHLVWEQKADTINLEKEGMMPLVIIVKNGLTTNSIKFDTINENKDLVLKYESETSNPYLTELRKKYPIDSVVSGADNDLERVKRIASWVHNLWEHDGWSEPEKNEAMYILDEVKKGRRFRCVEYGIVTTACLNSIGIKSRVLALKTEDVETRPLGAGHVLLEVFVEDINKWIMVDPQWDIIPHLQEVPLNAVEFQAAITDRKNVQVWTSNKENTRERYIPWIYPYLYYFSVHFDNRENIKKDRIMYKGKRDLMLVPEGAKNPTVFQQKNPIDYMIYTHSIKDFYKNPN